MLKADWTQPAFGNQTRRAFLQGASAGIAGFFLLREENTALAANDIPQGNVTIVEFSDLGQRLRKLQQPKVVKSEQEWRKLLSANAFNITRHADTEIAFTGQYWNLHDKGLYRCICCSNALFSS